LASGYRGLVVSMIHKFDDIPANINTRESVVVLVLNKIINGRSTTECLIDIDIDPSYKKTISKIVVFTRTPFMQEYRVLVSQ
jgi:hypothetical protein